MPSGAKGDDGEIKEYRINVRVMLHRSTLYTTFLNLYTSMHNLILHLYFRHTTSTISEAIRAVGRVHNEALDEPTAEALRKLTGNFDLYREGLPVTSYSRVISRNMLLFSRSTSRSEKRNSHTCTVAFIDPQKAYQVSFGNIEKLITISNVPEATHIAVISPLALVRQSNIFKHTFPSEMACVQAIVTDDYVFPQKEQQPVVAVPIENITLKCFNVSTSTLSVLCMLIKNIDSK